MTDQHQTPAITCAVCGHRDVEEDRTRVCLPCEHRMVAQLDYLTVAVPLLWVIARNEPTPAGELNLHALGLAEHARLDAVHDEHHDQAGSPSIASVLGSWVEAWGGREVFSANAVSCAGWLRRRVRRGCDRLDGIEEFAKELRQLYALARSAIGRDWSGTRYPVPCPNCGGKTLIRLPGADWIECGPCEWLWEEGEYVELAKSTVRTAVPAEALLTAEEIRTMFRLRAGRVRVWRDRGVLQAQIGPWGAVARYARADVEQLLARWEAEVQRRAAKKAEQEINATSDPQLREQVNA